MEIFNAGADKFSIGFEEGGVPYYNTDVLNSQDNAQLWGIPSIYRDYNMVLSGCLVDEVNITDGTIKITEGFVLYQNLVFRVSNYDGSYPVQIQINDPIVEQRDFKSGETHDATLVYTSQWTTSITTPTSNNYPIIFKPFCDQRIENYNENIGKVLGEIREVMVTRNVRTKTDTTKTIQGGTLTIPQCGIFAGWEQVVDARVTVPANNSTYVLADTFGDWARTLLTNNLPEHQHELSQAEHDSTATTTLNGQHSHNVDNVNMSQNGNHSHEFTFSGDENLDNSSFYPLLRQNPDIDLVASGYNNTQRRAGLTDNGEHNHTLSGNTSEQSNHEHNLLGNTGKGVDLVPGNASFSISQPSVVVLRLKFVGYPQMFNHTNTFASIF